MPEDTNSAGVATIFLNALPSDNSPRVFEDGRQMRVVAPAGHGPAA